MIKCFDIVFWVLTFGKGLKIVSLNEGGKGISEKEGIA